MSSNRHLDEDDLIQYAMRLLPEPERSDVARWIAEDPQARQRLLELQTVLGLYAEVAVEVPSNPDGSLQRLMGQIAREPRRAEGPILVPRKIGPSVQANQPASKRQFSVLPGGWAIAAVLALSLGFLGWRLLLLHRLIAARNEQIASLTVDASQLRQERDTLQANVTQQTSQDASLKSKVATTEVGAANLKAKLADQTTSLTQQAASAAEAERDRDRLQGTIAAQENQIAQLSAATKDTGIFAALTDPSALRVVLTKPKSKPVPSGRAAYVASKGTLVFLGANFAPLKTSKVYELWLLPADGSSPVPAGTFVPDARGNANLTYAHFPDAVPAKGFAVSVEKVGGTQVPTPPLLIAGSS